MKSDYTMLKLLARDYLHARHNFLEKSAAYPELAGNDNLMGRIGEMIAVQFLRSQGRWVDKHDASNHPVTDLVVKTAGGLRFISVKLISAENKRGITTALKVGWDEFILVELGAGYIVKRLGWLTIEDLRGQNQEAIVMNSPVTNRRMLEAGGLIGKFGKVFDAKEPADASWLRELL